MCPWSAREEERRRRRQEGRPERGQEGGSAAEDGEGGSEGEGLGIERGLGRGERRNDDSGLQARRPGHISMKISVALALGKGVLGAPNISFKSPRKKGLLRFHSKGHGRRASREAFFLCNRCRPRWGCLMVGGLMVGWLRTWLVRGLEMRWVCLSASVRGLVVGYKHPARRSSDP